MKRLFRIDHLFLRLILGGRWKDKVRLVEIGRPFFIEHQGIEFSAGIVAEEGGILISYGVGDRLTRLLQIPHAVIEQFLSI